MLYLIGGVTRSGKTTLRHALQRERPMAGATTDTVRENIARTRPHWGIGSRTRPRENMALLEPHIEAFLDSLAQAGDDFVLEGDALSPATAAKFALAGRACCIFLLYPHVGVEEKLAQLRERNEGWIALADDDFVRRAIEVGIENSLALRDSCALFAVPFLDTSEMDLPSIIRAGREIFLNGKA